MFIRAALSAYLLASAYGTSNNAEADPSAVSALPTADRPVDLMSLNSQVESSLEKIKALTQNLHSVSSSTQDDLGASFDTQRVPIMRRHHDPTESHRMAVAENVGREQSTDSEDKGSDTLHSSFHEDPRFTPEAIFADKKLAPEIAEFLGHLAQRDRVHRREVKTQLHQARVAGLTQDAAARIASPNDDEEGSDDIEDMKKFAANRPKTTPLSHFLDKIDSKTTAASWFEKDCAALARNITVKYGQLSGRTMEKWGSVGPAGLTQHSEIHTGMFFHHWDEAKKAEAARKLRLNALSFLATQDAGKMKLHIWTDLKKDDQVLKDVLGPILKHPEFMDAINITTFDHEAELAKVPPTFARETLTEMLKKDSNPAVKPDLFRAIVLYNYGGVWMDADTVLLRDVAPLLGEDWAYLVKGSNGAVDGAMLSTSSPASHFANNYLIKLVMRDLEPDDTTPLLLEVSNADPSHTTMHVLPPCFFDSDTSVPSTEAAVLSSDASPGSDFFGKTIPEPYRAMFTIGIQAAKEEAVKDNSTSDASVLEAVSNTEEKSSNSDEDDAPRSASWAYHWRGNFAAPWVSGSMADVAERTFMKRLGLKHHH